VIRSQPNVKRFCKSLSKTVKQKQTQKKDLKNRDTQSTKRKAILQIAIKSSKTKTYSKKDLKNRCTLCSLKNQI
jgi:hypothetical protein